jgi:hypothetical protein
MRVGFALGNFLSGGTITMNAINAFNAALDGAIANYPGQRFTLRNGALVIRRQ